MQKEHIERLFSKVAVSYDRLSGFHQKTAKDLLGQIHLSHDFSGNILDVGMGTGWLTKKMQKQFLNANVFGLDFSKGMLHSARKNNLNIQLIQGDASCLPFKEDSFDLIVSNLVYQWIEKLEEAFCSCYSSLNQKGILLFSLFGHNTFKELFESLENSFKKRYPKKDFVIDRLAKKKCITQALSRAGFKNIEIKGEEVMLAFEDMIGLIRWIKGIGANALSRDFFVGKELLLQANNYYKSNFKEQGKVFASLEVIWVEARK